MSTYYDKASLVMIPSGVKEDKLYSIKPTDGSGDFTFSRGSDIQATRVNSSGLIEKAKVNLVTYSNDFITGWLDVVDTWIGGQAGYDGSNDAWKLTSNGGYTYQVNSSTGVLTFSVYAKAGTAAGLRLRIDQNPDGDVNAYFNLSTGSVTLLTGNDQIDAKMESVGNGWYRCSVAFNSQSLANLRFYPTDAVGATPNVGDNIYIQDAQLNHGLIAQDYVETTTTAVVEGLTADLPRLDYSGGASCPSLLLEPSRTNLVPYSEYFGASDWTKTNATITSNAATSPEGVDNASLYTSSNATNAITDGITAANGTYTLSAFFKRDATDSVRMNFSDGVTGEIRYVFNLTDETSTLTKSGGTISDYSADFEDYGNGWYRLHITATTNAGTAITAYFETDNETGSFYLFGAQLEAGSYPTSYIPTYGTAANRGADSGYKTSASDLIGQTEGTIFAEFEIPKDFYTTEDYRFSIGDGGINNWIFVSIYNTDNIRVFVRTASTTSIDETELGVISHGTTYKVALAYKSGSTSCYLNGTEIISSSATISAPSSSLSNLNLTGDSSIQTSSPQTIGVNLKQRVQFKTRLTNAELAALTTI